MFPGECEGEYDIGNILVQKVGDILIYMYECTHDYTQPYG